MEPTKDEIELLECLKEVRSKRKYSKVYDYTVAVIYILIAAAPILLVVKC